MGPFQKMIVFWTLAETNGKFDRFLRKGALGQYWRHTQGDRQVHIGLSAG